MAAYFRLTKKGFSLVEVITILFIVSLSLLGILSLIIQNIQSQTYNKNNLIAYQLAQEGVELIRRVRDTNWEAGNPYKTNLDDGQYYMDYLDNVPTLYSGNPSELLLKFDANGFYIHDSAGAESGFSRLITISNIDVNSFSVNVSVTWQERNRDTSYDLQVVFYDWF